MNKIKLLLLITFIFIFTGCTATYEVEIYNDEVRENFSFIETNTSLLDNNYDGAMHDYQSYTYGGLIDFELKNDTPVYIDIDSVVYKKKKLSADGIGINYKASYPLKTYNKSFIGNSSFKYFNFISNNDTYILSTSAGTTVFENYKYLDSVTIHLKTNHKVKDSNADIINGYNYYWEINKNNYKNKSIYLEFYKDKYVFNYENKITIIFIVSIVVAFLIFIVIIFLRRRTNKNNRI